MIADSIALQELRQSWDGVRGLRSKVQVLLLASFTQGASAVIRLADIAHNLPFLHACSVLNDILLQLQDENHFQCKRRTLGALINASQYYLPWNNFPLVEEAVARRNDLAHRSDIVPRGDCWRYIDVIENELLSWKIINPA